MWLLLISRKLQISFCDFEKQNHFYDLKKKKKKNTPMKEKHMLSLSVVWGKHVTSILRNLRDELKKYKKNYKKVEFGISFLSKNLYKRYLFV